ncbi:hypothetical protein G7046_g7209 [Stylonectria norvegica]|nr:hypothetical protein G7046_g7209 [Stylonectria norvegica]
MASISHVETAKAWLTECLAHHTSCSKKPRFNTIWCTDNSHTVQDLEAESSMPKRLLAFDIVPPQDAQKPDRVKLVTVDKELQYFALSHRWGPNETFKARERNFKMLAEEGVLVAELPKTYREAVEATRSLGYGYLWIDSLCIVQDNKDDWHEEARRMACVYGNSVCTITALDARDSNAGLLASPSAEAVSQGDSLEQRAWVLQERMIPPRSLLFGGHLKPSSLASPAASTTPRTSSPSSATGACPTTTCRRSSTTPSSWTSTCSAATPTATPPSCAPGGASSPATRSATSPTTATSSSP